MKRISLFLQEVIKIFAFFLLFFVWIRYFLHSFWTAFAISILCSIGLYAFLLFFSKRKQTRKGLKLKEKEDAANMFLSLIFSSNPMEFFLQLVKKKHPQAEKHQKYISICYSLEKAKTILWFDDSFDGLTQAKLVRIYNYVKKEKPTKIVVCCKEIADKNLFSFCLNFEEKIIVLDQFEMYEKLFKTYNYFPKITRTYQKEKRLVFKDLVAYSFNKKRTKSYLFSAFILVFSGLFVRATLYYCIISSILVLFAFISALNPYFNKTNEIL